MASNTGYQQAIIARKATIPSGYPLDVDGELTSVSGKRQAILLLDGQSNPDATKYEVEGTFRAGEVVDGKPTKQYNTGKCPISVPVYPDPYESSWVPKKKGKVLHWIHCSLGGLFNQNSAGITPGNYDVWLTDKSAGEITDGFWPSWTISMFVLEAFGSYPTIECDEIAFFQKPVAAHTGLNGNGPYSAYITKNRLQTGSMFDSTDVPNENDFLHAYGEYYPWGNVNSRAIYFPNTVTDRSDGSVYGNLGYQVYDIGDNQVQPAYDSVHNLTNRNSLTNVTGGSVNYADSIDTLRGKWIVPKTEVFLQLLGQLPRHHETNNTGTRLDDIYDFFLADNDSDPVKRIPSPVGSSWYHKNISGLGLLPNGKFQSGFGGQTQLNPDHFGTGAFMASFKSNGSIGMTGFIMDNSRNLTDIQGGNVVPYNHKGVAVSTIWYPSNVNGHNGNIRYCRVKTAEENGYKLVVDGNDILMVDPGDSRTDMPVSMERGIALRYTNRENRKVLIKYDELKVEAAELTSSVLIEQ